MRAGARRTIKSFSGRLERWRSGGFAQGSRLAQAKIAGGEKGGDLLDDGIKRVFSELHVHLLKREADVSAIGRVTGRRGREQRNRFAWSCRVGRRWAFDTERTLFCGYPAAWRSTEQHGHPLLLSTAPGSRFGANQDGNRCQLKGKNDAMLAALTFEFYRFRFQFRSAGTLYFPPYKSGNIVRGAFGSIFRKLVCIPSCRDAKICDVRTTCPYARVFEPQAARGEGPSGLADWPRPFVFRASHLDGSTVRQGEAFHFDVHIFDVRDPALAYFVLAFAQLAREGLGPGRARADLAAVDQLDLSGVT